MALSWRPFWRFTLDKKEKGKKEQGAKNTCSSMEVPALRTIVLGNILRDKDLSQALFKSPILLTATASGDEVQKAGPLEELELVAIECQIAVDTRIALLLRLRPTLRIMSHKRPRTAPYQVERRYVCNGKKFTSIQDAVREEATLPNSMDVHKCYMPHLLPSIPHYVAQLYDDRLTWRKFFLTEAFTRQEEDLIDFMDVKLFHKTLRYFALDPLFLCFDGDHEPTRAWRGRNMDAGARYSLSEFVVHLRQGLRTLLNTTDHGYDTQGKRDLLNSIRDAQVVCALSWLPTHQL